MIFILNSPCVSDYANKVCTPSLIASMISNALQEDARHILEAAIFSTAILFLLSMMSKERLINAHVFTRRAFPNFISFPVPYNQRTDGERVCTLQSPIGPFWSHALFLIPLRTCFIAFSPHTVSDHRNHRTTARVGLLCLIVVFSCEKKP